MPPVWGGIFLYHIILSIGLLTKICVSSQRFFRYLRHITNNTNFVFIAVIQYECNILFKLNLGLNYIVAEQIIACNLQSVCDIDYGI